MISWQELDRHPSWAQCAACGETFLSDTAFDYHRMGTDSPTRRRCVLALDVLGFVKRNGVWGSREAHRDRAAKSQRIHSARQAQSQSHRDVA